MRILHLDSGHEMRGGQWQVLRLIEGLRGAGHESLLLARAGSPLLAQAARRAIDAQTLSLLAARRAGRSVDIVHAHDARSHTMGVLAGARRLVVSRRVAFSVGRSPASRWKYLRAAHYIAVSQFVRSALVNAGVPESKITVVYDGVAPRPFSPEPASPEPASPQTASPGTEILAPDTADPRKGTELALAAAKLAGIPVKLSRDLDKDLARAGLFVYITHSEGLGSAVLMAMAAGVPVIASNVGGLPEIVEHERTGLLTENKPEAIAGAITRLMRDRTLAGRLATQARATVQEKFSADRMVARIIEVYIEVYKALL